MIIIDDEILAKTTLNKSTEHFVKITFPVVSCRICGLTDQFIVINTDFVGINQ